MDRLTPLAAMFLEAEDVDEHASLAIGSLAVFEGPTPDFEEFVRTIEGRLPLIPRYRQKVRRVVLDLAAPAWVDDPEFDVRRHVRRTALPAPGGRHEIDQFLSQAMTSRMDRNSPLWECWFCEGLADGRWALLSKIHHSMVDGVSGTDLYRLILDPTRSPREPVPDDWRPAVPASALTFTAVALLEAASSLQIARAVTAALGAPRRSARTAMASTRGLWKFTSAIRPVHATSLMGTLDGSRRYAWTQVSIADIRAVRTAHDVTFNDVALAAVTGGFRRLLEHRGETPDAHALRSLVPVSMRAPGEESIPDNRVSLMLPYLPVDVADPVERLKTVHRRIRELQASHEPEAGSSLTSLASLGPFAAVSEGIRLGLRLPQRHVATVTTNVPGPRMPLYALGRELKELLPYVPIADRVRIGVAIISYRDTLTFGLTGDYETARDLDVLADAIAESMRELVDEARARAGSTGSRPSTA
ncbi:MAG: wax ester/triacylglycerol synthase family O-acyltransferase [Nocardioidaceae bacterium]